MAKIVQTVLELLLTPDNTTDAGPKMFLQAPNAKVGLPFSAKAFRAFVVLIGSSAARPVTYLQICSAPLVKSHPVWSSDCLFPRAVALVYSVTGSFQGIN